MIPYLHEAIRLTYPSAISITGDDLPSIIALDVDGNQIAIDDALVEPNIIVVQEQNAVADCKKQASKLLYETDWTTIPDVANPENNPYLMNQADFIAYRNQVRQLAVNPVTNPVWPTKPTEQWSS